MPRRKIKAGKSWVVKEGAQVPEHILKELSHPGCLEVVVGGMIRYRRIGWKNKKPIIVVEEKV